MFFCVLFYEDIELSLSAKWVGVTNLRGLICSKHLTVAENYVFFGVKGENMQE